MWKSRAGKEGKISYSSIKTVSRTGMKSFSNRNEIILMSDELYTVTYDYKPKPNLENYVPPKKYEWTHPPGAIVLNRENTEILIERLKEIDPELKDVEIIRWDG